MLPGKLFHEASRVEREYGDDPSWGYARLIAERLAETEEVFP
jgi:hypothetical protein